MDLAQAIGSDAALLFFSFIGLAVTTVAILVDTRVQRAELAREPIRIER